MFFNRFSKSTHELISNYDDHPEHQVLSYFAMPFYHDIAAGLLDQWDSNLTVM